jgi:hypothetical protein
VWSPVLLRIVSEPARGAKAQPEESAMTASSKKTSPKKSRWVKNVKTESTYPPEGLFTKDPETIARQLASKRVSPKGPGSGMRMLTYYINRAGKGLSAAQKGRLEKAKKLLSVRVEDAKEKAKRHAA